MNIKTMTKLFSPLPDNIPTTIREFLLQNAGTLISFKRGSYNGVKYIKVLYTQQV